jgi:beta-galactosidase
VFTSGDEAELFLNGKSQGRKKKGEYEYRLRWDDVRYEPGELRVVAYKNNEIWAEEIVETTGEPLALKAEADRAKIKADGKDLSFITIEVLDENGLVVPVADNEITFSVDGPGKIVATDNGDPTDMVEFPSEVRNAFNGKALAIVKAKKGETGRIIVVAESDGLEMTTVEIAAQ